MTTSLSDVIALCHAVDTNTNTALYTLWNNGTSPRFLHLNLALMIYHSDVSLEARATENKSVAYFLLPLV